MAPLTNSALARLVLGADAGGDEQRGGDGTWRDDGTPVTTTVSSATELAIGHLDDDATFDVVVSTNDNALIPALGAGDGTFALGTAITPGYVNTVAVGDIDGDGHADAVGSNPISDDIYLAIGDGSGGLTSGLTLTPAVDSATGVRSGRRDRRAERLRGGAGRLRPRRQARPRGGHVQRAGLLDLHGSVARRGPRVTTAAWPASIS